MFQCPNQFSKFVQKIKGQMEASFPPTKFKSSQMSLYRDSLSSQITGNRKALWQGTKIGWEGGMQRETISENTSGKLEKQDC